MPRHEAGRPGLARRAIPQVHSTANRRRHWLVVGLVTVVLGAGACSDDSQGTGPDATVDEQRAFIDNIVPHHQIALIRADEAQAKATRQGLKTLAQRMKTDQAREIAEFKTIRLQLVGSDITPPAMMPPPIPAGPEFERQWAMMMINHHQGAINSSTLAHGANVRGRLDSLAHNAIDAQRREQQELRDSIRVWYGNN